MESRKGRGGFFLGLGTRWGCALYPVARLCGGIYPPSSGWFALAKRSDEAGKPPSPFSQTPHGGAGFTIFGGVGLFCSSGSRLIVDAVSRRHNLRRGVRCILKENFCTCRMDFSGAESLPITNRVQVVCV